VARLVAPGSIALGCGHSALAVQELVYRAGGLMLVNPLLAPGADGDKLMELALESGAEDIVEQDDGSFEVLTAPEDFEQVRDALKAAGLKPDSAESTMRASVDAPLDGDEAVATVRLLEALEDLDDVQRVYTNADIPDEVLESL
jgi:transcriptional/translational regulatory protein YebC/TACO1